MKVIILIFFFSVVRDFGVSWDKSFNFPYNREKITTKKIFGFIVNEIKSIIGLRGGVNTFVSSG